MPSLFIQKMLRVAWSDKSYDFALSLQDELCASHCSRIMCHSRSEDPAHIRRPFVRQCDIRFGAWLMLLLSTRTDKPLAGLKVTDAHDVHRSRRMLVADLHAPTSCFVYTTRLPFIVTSEYMFYCIMASVIAKRIAGSLLLPPRLTIRFHPTTATTGRWQANLVLLRHLSSGKIKSTTKRAIERSKQLNQDDNGVWSVIAYNLSEELQIDNAQTLLEKFREYRLSDLPQDLQDEAVMLKRKEEEEKLEEEEPPRREDENQGTTTKPLNDIFLFKEGSIVFWGVPYSEQKKVLYGLSALKVNPNSSELIQEEKEHINYSILDSIERSRLNRDTIELATNQDVSELQADQFAFSHAVAQSVKLGIWEMTLDAYIESVAWVTDSMKSGKAIKLTKDQVFKKTGEILGLKHDINLNSDLLDLPDIYWDRRDQERIFMSVIAYLNIRKRTNVINEKLSNCCELMNLLGNHMNDKHHIRLEWMIIVLITVEVLFEVARFL